MKQLLILLILTLGFFGCQDVKQPEKPKNLIAKDKMVDILTETYLTNAARSVDNKTMLNTGLKMDSLIYKNFGVDSLQFAKSNAFYANDINTYMNIFLEVESRLDSMRVEMDSIWERRRLKNDSVNDVKKKRERIDVN
ncbi:DUF4296 domain-containing protein [Aequorivita marina]|uniref:DUF4296 domain-containing protein n=1 Tax=Aequorivita marina TaxID=3073654 RepID=UPI002876B599|nr:DUF4296 domain-containing protein [Aequorivita sp. S2608]MDS1299513.1 DUF4296 domain-containing protein [Aequorivita sp. S2608]